MTFLAHVEELRSPFSDGVWLEDLKDFEALVRADERKDLMQLFTDPENQPTQHGTVTLEYMQREIAAEREVIEDEFWMSLQSDLENGVKSLNEKAAADYQKNYPGLMAFTVWLNKRGVE